MEALAFLQSLWPSSGGFYCLAIKQTKGFRHKVYKTIEEAAAGALVLGAQKDVYFNMHVLKEERVWDATKKQFDGTIGGWTYRTHKNMAGAKCFFGDIDVGPSKEYIDRETALAALKDFCRKTRLPTPTILISGVGFHIFWPLSKALRSDKWSKEAGKIRRLALHHGFKIDPTRIDDVSSVLRVPGTKHFKDPTNPKPVIVAKQGSVTNTTSFIALLDDACAQLPAATVAEEMQGSTGLSFDTLSTLGQVGEACAVTRRLVKNSATASEPEWYWLLQLLRFVDEGHAWAHKLSAMHPDYDKATTDAKIAQAADKSLGPPTCGKFSEFYSGQPCAGCWYVNNPTSSPVVAAKRMPMKVAPPELVEQEIPLPPAPYSRLKLGGVAMAHLVQGQIIICGQDVYPVDVIHNPQDKTRETVWEASLPRRGKVQFTIPAPDLYDVAKIAEAASNAGLMLKPNMLNNMKDYMSLYINELQKYRDDKKQHSHLGWTEGYKEFVLRTEMITSAGRKPCMVNDNVATAAQHVVTKGTLAEQVKHLEFYNRPEYIAHQFFMMCSLGAALFYMTGHHGSIVNISGESGASKSTALYTGASFWGSGEEYAINGTNNGATVKFRNEKVSILSNLPICVDEITHMPADEAKDLAMSISQLGGRGRLDNKGREKKAVSTNKSTLMLSTSNKSLHEILSNNNAAGTAGSMRVFEIAMEKVYVHTKIEADDFLYRLRDNYGHIGPAFVERIMKIPDIHDRVRARMARIDTLGSVDAAERFWSGVLAGALEASYVAYEAGLVPFKPEKIEQWAIAHQLKAMRGAVKQNYSDPTDTLMAFMGEISPDLLVVTKAPGGSSILRKPRGELTGRYEVHNQTIYISQHAFKAYCLRTGTPLNAAISAFEKSNVAKKCRYTLGKDTDEYNYGQTNVIEINLKNQLISGREEITQLNNVVAIGGR